MTTTPALKKLEVRLQKEKNGAKKLPNSMTVAMMKVMASQSVKHNPIPPLPARHTVPHVQVTAAPLTTTPPVQTIPAPPQVDDQDQEAIDTAYIVRMRREEEADRKDDELRWQESLKFHEDRLRKYNERLARLDEIQIRMDAKLKIIGP